jgi:hypothetical protein
VDSIVFHPQPFVQDNVEPRVLSLPSPEFVHKKLSLATCGRVLVRAHLFLQSALITGLVLRGSPSLHAVFSTTERATSAMLPREVLGL